VSWLHTIVRMPIISHLHQCPHLTPASTPMLASCRLQVRRKADLPRIGEGGICMCMSWLNTSRSHVISPAPLLCRLQVRRKADPAKELVREFVGKWQEGGLCVMAGV
jgi:hypothetical protein